MNLKRSLKLYKMLEPHLPEDLELEPFDFISIIVHNIKESKRHNDYIDILEFVSGMPRSELLSMEFIDLFEMFAEGMTDLQIIYLAKFCKKMGLSDA